MIDPRVLFEDEVILVLDKPAGLVVNRADSVREATLQDWIEAYRTTSGWLATPGGQDEAVGDFQARSGIVHRLDKETSGVMVVAKTPAAFSDLVRQFSERTVNKIYTTLVHGRLQPSQGSLALPLARRGSLHRRVSIVPSGKKAVTHWRVIRIYENLRKPLPVANDQGYSLVEVRPETGRTHQIRAHLEHLRHPVVGDSLYGGRRARNDREWCPRQFLHATSITFGHPISRRRIGFRSPLPQELRAALARLTEKELPRLEKENA